MAHPARFEYFSILKSGSAMDRDMSSTITTCLTRCNLLPASAARRLRIFFRFEAVSAVINAPFSSLKYLFYKCS